MNVRLVLALFAIAPILVNGACGGPDVKEATSDRSAATAKQEVDGEEVEAYFEAHASNDVAELESAAKLAAPGSLANAYALHQSNVENASIDAGQPSESGTTKKVDGGYRICETQIVDVEGTEEETCYTYADFESTDGKLASFTINGKELDDRISLGNGEKVKAGRFGRIEFLSSYKSAANDLYVTVRFTTRSVAASFGGYEATYRSPEGRQATASGHIGNAEVDADSTSYEAIIFSKAEPGGVVRIPISSEDFMSEKVVRLKTR